MVAANDDAPAPLFLPIRVGTTRANFRVTYVCRSLREAGEAIRDFRRTGDRLIVVRDASGRGASNAEMTALLDALVPTAHALGAVA